MILTAGVGSVIRHHKKVWKSLFGSDKKSITFCKTYTNKACRCFYLINLFINLFFVGRLSDWFPFTIIYFCSLSVFSEQPQWVYFFNNGYTFFFFKIRNHYEQMTWILVTFCVPQTQFNFFSIQEYIYFHTLIKKNVSYMYYGVKLNISLSNSQNK